MDLKAVLFDMDGVLVDAKKWHFSALNKALEIFGFSISHNEHLNKYDGLPTLKKLEMLSSDKCLPYQLHDYINELKQKYTTDIVNMQCRPRFCHEYALSKLKSEGLLLGVCSNSIKHTIELMMEKSNLRQYLDIIVSNEDVIRAKPDPEMYNYAISKLGLVAGECLIVEDNINGIKAAKASGANLLVVENVNEVNYENINTCILKYYKKC